MKRPTVKWMQLLAGILMVVAGVVAFIMPNAFTSALIWVMSLSILMGGISMLVFYLRNKDFFVLPATLLIAAILDILLGVLLIFAGTITAGAVFIYLLAAWFVLMGALRIVGAAYLYMLRVPKWWPPLVLGIISILLAIVLFANPINSLLALGIMIGIYAVMDGVVHILDFFTFR